MSRSKTPAASERLVVYRHTVCAQCGTPTWDEGETLCSDCSVDPWAPLRGLEPLEQWNADGNR